MELGNRDLGTQNRNFETRERKIFDPRDETTLSRGDELLDACIAKRDGRWWICMAGQSKGRGLPDLYSAVPKGDTLHFNAEWEPIRTSEGELVPLAGRTQSRRWDAKGGRHCPTYVRGWDPHCKRWVERVYYAGGAEQVWGPYTIGFVEWDGSQWLDQPEPAFVANEEWEHGSVYEPNLIYCDGKWKMWYVAGSNHEDYLVHAYAESEDGRTNWSGHRIFAPAQMKMFDFCVRQRGMGFDAIFSRVAVRGDAPPETGLWWCTSRTASGDFADWSEPVQIMTAEDRGWHSGAWKPTFEFDEREKNRAYVFFDGLYRTTDPGPFPFAFTLGCMEIELPNASS